jgi:uncharacterized protein (DUF362 family)
MAIRPKPQYSLSRRDFLKLSSAASAALALSACGVNPTQVVLPTPSATLIPSTTPPPPTSTSTPEPTATETPAFKTHVALGKAATYDPSVIRPALEAMLAGLGGLDKLVKSGARVGIKVNLTGGTWWDSPDKPPATEYFVTHPAVTRVLCELLHDLGASSITIMDGLGDETSFDKWGYSAMAAPLGAKLIDLCQPKPYAGFMKIPVGPQAQVYDHFTLHPVLTEIDVFISVGKMKTHSIGGVTLSMKNLFGLAPISYYRRSSAENNRSFFHEGTSFDARLAKIILDLNLVRPIHLAVIDGIMTADRGAGPWDAAMTQVKPGVLAAGFDPVATDAAVASVMGFDPTAQAPNAPFVHTENYLSLAHDLGIGTNLPEEIGLEGEPLESVSFPFHLP